MPGLAAVFGKSTSAFLNEGWGHSWRHFSDGSRSFEHLISVGVLRHIVTSVPLTYERSVKLVKDGKTHFTSDKRVMWTELQDGLEQGATALWNQLHRLHLPLYSLCSDLERDLNVWVWANVYLTPGQTTMGFDPHADDHDIVILQAEGEKTWHVCQRLDADLAKWEQDGRYKHPKLEELSDCSQATLSPGDVLYVPYGTPHYAEAVGDGPALHVTLGLRRHTFAWRELLLDLAHPSEEDDDRPLAAALSTAASVSPGMQQQLPRLADLARSLDNDDLPQDFHAEWRRACAEVLERAELPGGLRQFLQRQVEDQDAWSFAVRNMRLRLVLGTLVPLGNCPGAAGRVNMTSRFRRRPGVRVASQVLDKGDHDVIALGVDGFRSDLPSEWEDAVSFALSAFRDTASRGAAFSLKELRSHAASDEEALDVAKTLLKVCALEFAPAAGRAGAPNAEL